MLEVNQLSLEVLVGKKWLPAVKEVSFSLEEGEILGIIGESGSGKTLTAKALMNILPPKVRIGGGTITYKNQNLQTLPEKEWRNIYGKEMSFIFQNPAVALNPVIRIGEQIMDAYLAHKSVSRSTAKTEALAILEQVGITEPERVFKAYPHELSGGMKQRVVIGIAVIHQPSIVIADEATTALDATVRKQILDLFRTLSRDLNISFILISHDIAAIKYIANSILLLYGGEKLEYGKVDDVFSNTRHPYTHDLLQAVPHHAIKGQRIKGIPGTLPNITASKSGCIYAPRCSYATDDCETLPPTLMEGGRHFVHGLVHQYACHHPLDKMNIVGKAVLEERRHEQTTTIN
ncbi:ABC transporter ATP-binding protein [Evansella sp. AB-rgal1]|uniref:ABC transporter ATP-binding protein n=1 Tax=Evansella sp. AB-rgal1 TaxID=3242696 RepID=UPI00359E9AFE